MFNKIIKARFLLSILIILLTITACTENTSNFNLSIHVIDVGQGDSILIVTPNQRTILIDAGDNIYGDDVVQYIKKQGIKRIDALIGTHPHADHIGGLPEVIDSLEIGSFYMTAKLHTTRAFEEVLEATDKKGLTITTAKKGVKLQLDEDVNIEFLSPIGDSYDDLNNWSAVLRLEYKKKAFLFTGDAEALLEKEIIEVNDASLLKANFLKVAHHGSNSSTSQEFLDIVAPEVAVISLGKDNPYGFPHRELLERLKVSDISIYRTDLQGDIVVESDGIEIWSYQKPIK